MANLNELATRLQQLEDGYYADKQAAKEKQFFDTYGERFSNNRGLGLAILNELDARGVDTSAADEAVTQILDQLRTDCNEIIESIKIVQDAAIQNAQKIEQMGDVIADAVASNPNATLDNAYNAEASIKAAENPILGNMGGTDAEFVPPPVGWEDEAPVDEAPVDELPVDEAPVDEAPVDEAPVDEAPVDEAPAAGRVTSDSRLKRIKNVLATRKNNYTPSAGILAAVQGK